MKMDETVFEVYRSRGEQLSNAMRLCADDMQAYSSAVALLAIHSAISYNDALLTYLRGTRPKPEDHRTAIKVTRRACAEVKLDSTGINHLEKLLREKSDVSYGDRAVLRDRAQVLSIAAERFQAWVESSLAPRGRRVIK